jgi:hypothetical protein
MAQRAGAQITQVEGSHLIMVPQPHVVLMVIRAARASFAPVTVPEPRPA